MQNCDWDASLAYDATAALITEYPELKGIFACNDTMALAAVEAALSAAGLAPLLSVAPRDLPGAVHTVCRRSVCRG